uniref:PH domain-containing protein n=1 Tax=Panagrolaimus sp. JU765 TaxID=591449 RepID=A0AC34R9P2_9BILA
MVVQQFGTKLLKKSSSSTMLRNGFSLELKDKGELLTLTTENDEILKLWIDGLNILLGNEILNSKEFEEEVNNLVDMEVQVRLLDIKTLPQIPPIIPELPTNFDWIPKKYRVKKN